MSQVSSDTDLWEIFFIISNSKNSFTDDDFIKTDNIVASKLQSAETVIEYHHYFAWNIPLHEKMPLTKNKLNELLSTCIIGDNATNFPNWFISSISGWLEEPVRLNLLNKWLENEGQAEYDLVWLLKYAEQNNELFVKIFNKLVKSYKDDKSRDRIKDITDLFLKLNDKYLKEACETLSKSTPAVSVCLLSRPDIEDDYMIQGLKSLSKLSKQRMVNIKLDFNMLSKLGPKARLDAMKQLLGLMSKWYHKKPDALPFKKIPDKTEVANFLFPCSIKYNKEVAEVIQKFDELTKPKSSATMPNEIH